MAPDERAPRTPDEPEPDEALAGTADRTPDHDPADEDDREVLFDDPQELDAVLDDDDEPGQSESR